MYDLTKRVVKTVYLTLFLFYLEMVIITIFAYNILEATHAIKYPCTPLPQITSPAAKSKSSVITSPTPKRAFKVLSPNVSLTLLSNGPLDYIFYHPLLV